MEINPAIADINAQVKKKKSTSRTKRKENYHKIIKKCFISFNLI